MSQELDNTPQEDNVEPKEDSQTFDLTSDMIDRMSDEEFDKYINDGTIPESLQQTKEIEEESNDDNNSEESDNTDSEEPNTEEDTESNDSTVEDKEEPKIDYEKAYKELFDTPIKADGTEIKLNSKDELIALVQKGVNFTRKSQELSKKRKIIQSLEEANIKTDEDLNLLIDIYKGKPEAIKSFIKNKNIDIDSYEDGEEAQYVPTNNIVSDKEVQLTEVIDEIKSSPYFDKISNILSNIWDKDSIDMVSKDPNLLAGLYGEVSQNRFDEIHAKVVRDKLFSNSKKPDIVRYMEYAKEIEDNKTKSISDTGTNTETETKSIKVKPVVGNKKSASINKNINKSVKKVITAEDIDKLSDEELLKLKL